MPITRFVCRVALLAAVVGASAQAPPTGRTLVAHDFATSAEGWGISTDTGTADPDFHAAGGHPGGYIGYVDEAVGETWYFRAPESALKALRAAEDGTLSYSLKQSMEPPGFIDDDVIIQGPAGRLSFRTGRTPGTAWSDFTVPLTASAGWRWNWNAEATPEQMRRVLTNATSLEIRGEFHTGPDEGGLDNVVLRAGR